MFDTMFIVCANSFNFEQTYLNTGLKTQNVEELSLDLIFHDNFWQSRAGYINAQTVYLNPYLWKFHCLGCSALI